MGVNVVRFHAELPVAVFAPAKQLSVGTDSRRMLRPAAHAPHLHAIKIRNANRAALVSVTAEAEATVVAPAPCEHAAVVADSHRVECAASDVTNGGKTGHNNRLLRGVGAASAKQPFTAEKLCGVRI